MSPKNQPLSSGFQQKQQPKDKPVIDSKSEDKQKIRDYISKNTKPIENLYKISVKPLYYNKFRVNVWEDVTKSNCIVTTRRIVNSYFVEYNEKDGTVKICT